MIRLFLASATLWLFAGAAFSQNAVSTMSGGDLSLLDDFVIPEFPPFGFLVTYFPSELIGNSLELKSYVRSKRFRRVREQFGDLRSVDALYIRALRLTQGNSAMALLYCTLATMDHDIVGIRIPLLRLFLPLTSESLADFDRRVANLPGRFYSDLASDRDKLQHFFGSAFVANAFESREAAERVGMFVEWGEDAFIVRGVYDERDMRANRQGREFGLSLLSRNPLPSYFLRVQPVASRSAQGYNQDHYLCGAW